MKYFKRMSGIVLFRYANNFQIKTENERQKGPCTQRQHMETLFRVLFIHFALKNKGFLQLSSVIAYKAVVTFKILQIILQYLISRYKWIVKQKTALANRSLEKATLAV